MKRVTLLLCAVAIVFAACNNDKTASEETTTSADSSKAIADAKPADNTPPPDSATMMKNWEAYMVPGAPHKMMASWDGTWNSSVTVWMSPDAPPMTSTGTTVNKTILGGRYQQSSHKGMMMGAPFEGIGTLAYDNDKKVFESTWIDNMGTGVMHLLGPWDEGTKTMTLTGKMIDPGTGKEIDAKETFTVNDDNNQTMAMFVPGPDGKEMKTMEIKFTRKK
jgi:hypothetical protein